MPAENGWIGIAKKTILLCSTRTFRTYFEGACSYADARLDSGLFMEILAAFDDAPNVVAMDSTRKTLSHDNGLRGYKYHHHGTL
ncbi:hypothetical protein OUZ56_019272 [Daphnia magna]|uniref:Transposase n=1 Tax=Daphnia magna TaxID=35525 RepID=A0ABQ9ZB45_9CRUS|nr:hypothetical protein OUZ56_019272 [Daphnia magna]